LQMAVKLRSLLSSTDSWGIPGIPQPKWWNIDKIWIPENYSRNFGNSQSIHQAKFITEYGDVIHHFEAIFIWVRKSKYSDVIHHLKHFLSCVWKCNLLQNTVLYF
jgi:hypothetical protein